MPYPLANLTSTQTELRVYYLNLKKNSRKRKKTTQWNVGTSGQLNRFIQYWFRQDSTATCWTLVSDKRTLITGSEKKGWAHPCSMSKVIFVNRKLKAKLGTRKKNTILRFHLKLDQSKKDALCQLNCAKTLFYLWAILYLVKICSLRNYREDHLSTLVFPSPLDVLSKYKTNCRVSPWW